MKNLTYILLLILITSVQLFSQPVEILDLINRSGLSLTDPQDEYLNSTAFDTSYLGYEALQILPDSIEHLSDVYFDIQELGGYREFYVEQVFYRDSFITWVGKSYDNYKYGTLILVQKGEFFSGFISQDNQIWELLPNGDNLVLALKRYKGHDQYYKCATPNDVDDPEDGIPDPCQIPPDDCTALIRVMVEMTEPALDWLGVMTDNIFPFNDEVIVWLYFLNVEAQVNTALNNSGVHNKFIQIAEVQTIEFIHTQIYYQSLGEFRNYITADIYELEINGEFLTDLVDYRCDIGILMTKADYVNNSGVVNEIGPDDGFCAIVEIQTALGHLFVFAHEVGHILGARHNRANDLNLNICNHAWKIPTPEEEVYDRTIVHAGEIENDNFILNYSNPFVKVNGRRTGTGVDFNAAAIANNGCYIANYESDPYWNIHIMGKDSICDDEPVNIQFEAEVHEGGNGYYGFAPFKYIWQWGYVWNETNFPNLDWISETDEENTLTIPYDPEDNHKELFVRLIVVSDDEYYLIKVKQIKLFPPYFYPYGCTGPVEVEWKPRSEENKTQTECGFHLTTLLNGDYLNISLIPYYNANENLDLSIEIFDLMGRMLYFQQENLPEYTEREILIGSLPPNVYFLKVNSVCDSKIVKFYKS